MQNILKLGSMLVFVVASCWLVVEGSAKAQSTPSPDTARAAMSTLDTDSDGTMDLAEAKAAAERHFAILDTDHDGTLDIKEAAAAGITKSVFHKFDADKDGTLSKDEYWALVEASFKAADSDHDGTVSVNELARPKGRVLLALLQ